MANEPKEKFWQKWRHKYKLSLLKEDTYEEIYSMRLSPLRVATVLSVLAVILVCLTIWLIAFTGLREFIPGYPDGKMRRMITDNALRVDSLEMEILKRDNYYTSLQRVLRGEDYNPVSERNDSIRPNYDTIRFDLSPEESEFRAAMEEKERFNLVVGRENNQKEYYHFFPPVEGIISRGFDEKSGHFGVDIVSKFDSKISTVLDGVVIFTDWTIKTGYVIQVQHANNLLSVYKHNSVLLKKQGDYVRAGEAIAVVGNTGEETTGQHLHFELWRAGNPLNPENFIIFK
ncbi:M23 family metallopeptidase [Odoribacter sp. OttesenSCG-928-G04]|nr:M23 family metallopeptidase [Odoribacter sp. OttesenSCG-928-G04]